MYPKIRVILNKYRRGRLMYEKGLPMVINKFAAVLAGVATLVLSDAPRAAVIFTDNSTVAVMLSPRRRALRSPAPR